MRIRAGVVALLACCSLSAVATGADCRYPFRDPALPVNARIDDVLSRMTSREKIEFLGKTLDLPRLCIHGSGTVPSPPGSGGQLEGLHGLAFGGPGRWGRKSPGGSGDFGGVASIPTTQFPQAVGLGETWDPALLRRVAAEEGLEARYIFQRFDRGGLIIRAPNADLARDPRWGRSEESYGEDPYLVGSMAAAFVQGLQGGDADHWLAASLLKHFLANSNEDNRSGSSSNFGPRLLHEYYARPFRMAIERGGADALMASYNAVNGIPMAASPLLESLAVKRWRLDGMIDTDRSAVTYMVTRHRYFANMELAVAGAIHAGVNQFLNPYQSALEAALRDGRVTQADLDARLRGVFRVMIHLGLLDPPQQDPYAAIGRDGAKPPWDTVATRELVLQATRESVVLLENAPMGVSPALLPLDASKLKSIAVVGSCASEVYGDFYGGTPPFAVTPLQGITARAGVRVRVAGAASDRAAVAAARAATVAIVVIGNDPTCGQAFGHCSDPSEGKEAIDRRRIDLEPDQLRLVRDVLAANPRTIVVLVSSFPYAIDWIQAHVPAVVQMTHSSEEEGTALAQVLFGDADPAGRLTVTWPRSLAQEPAMMDYDIRHGRTYMYFHGSPLYPFGYGLSYTRFKYSGLELSVGTGVHGARIHVAATVANVGKRPGDEVVQLYVQHLDSRVSRPRRELEGFERIHLQPGQSREVRFELGARSLAYWNEARRAWIVEPDRIRVMLGGSSADIRLETTLALNRLQFRSPQ